MNGIYIDRDAQKKIHLDWFRYKVYQQGKLKSENKKGERLDR